MDEYKRITSTAKNKGKKWKSWEDIFLFHIQNSYAIKLEK